MPEVMPDALGRLAAGHSGETFLLPHHLEASRRLCRLLERAQVRQRVTMSYDPARAGGVGRPNGQADLADSAAEARRRLNQLAGQVATDCWGVMVDVCLYEKGLQQIELERGWPRRSAKLVLRIGLDQLCGLFGLSAQAEGRAASRVTGWLPERPPMFAEEPPG
jgi:hypothetical protein